MCVLMSVLLFVCLYLTSKERHNMHLIFMEGGAQFKMTSFTFVCVCAHMCACMPVCVLYVEESHSDSWHVSAQSVWNPGSSLSVFM